MTDLNEIKQNRELSTFSKSVDNMIKYNRYGDILSGYRDQDRPNSTASYTLEKAQRIVQNGTIQEKQQMSRDFFARGGYYSRVLMYYATVIRYTGLLVPNPRRSEDMTAPYVEKRYNEAMDFVDELKLPKKLFDISLKVLIDGAYYGIIQELSKKNFAVLDLPFRYARSKYKDLYGNDIVEFNITYFDTIFDTDDRNAALMTYPSYVRERYVKYKQGKTTKFWLKIPSDSSVFFTLYQGVPLFIKTIPASIRYQDALETEKERDIEEIRKVLVQKMPHLNDGQLVFEPDEAAEMHRGTVEMLRGNKNYSVLTTYADVDSVVSKTGSDTVSNNLEKMMQNIFYEANTSSQIFSPTGNLAISTSIQNDVSLMMILARQYDVFISNVVNYIFGNINIKFKYMTLPVGEYNASTFINDSFKLAQSGYSFILPALGLGISQRDLGNLKDLENDVLKLSDKLKPLMSAYTQSGDGDGDVGAPEKPLEEKSPKTIQNQESIDKTGGAK